MHGKPFLLPVHSSSIKGKGKEEGEGEKKKELEGMSAGLNPIPSREKEKRGGKNEN